MNMKPTDINIAKYFNTTRQTLSRWKNGSLEYKRRYRAFVDDFIANNKGE